LRGLYIERGRGEQIPEFVVKKYMLKEKAIGGILLGNIAKCVPWTRARAGKRMRLLMKDKS